jgi:hypothetical protein
MWCGQPPLPTSGTTTHSDEFGMNRDEREM